ncbi:MULTISPECIES: hypothetical protein [Salinibaculum]|uniref:hypothetical protein n=1 Tax=Salinibaculum TaxID=2732368 RepID=UPI0030D3F55A
MAPEPRSALPERPLRKRELTELGRAGAYSVRRYSDEAYAIVFIGSEHVYGLGYDDDPAVTVTMGPGAAYDCPECEWFRTGRTTAPETFTDHLEDEHDYTPAKARHVLH